MNTNSATVGSPAAVGQAAEPPNAATVLQADEPPVGATVGDTGNATVDVGEAADNAATPTGGEVDETTDYALPLGTPN